MSIPQAWPVRELLMVIYVGMIAILNLSLGYALALYMGAGRGQLAATGASEPLESLDYSDSDVDE